MKGQVGGLVSLTLAGVGWYGGAPTVMKCPACFNELTTRQTGDFAVDVCQGGCGGIWFDAFELQRVDQNGELGEALLEVQQDITIVVDLSRKRECPRCPGIKLHRHFFSAKRRVQVDQCPNCNGYWLDAGELAQIRAEHSANDAAEKAKASTISSDFIRYLYKLEERERAQKQQRTG